MGSPPSNAATRTGVFNETLALSGTGTISGGSTDVGTGYVVTGMSLADGLEQQVITALMEMSKQILLKK